MTTYRPENYAHLSPSNFPEYKDTIGRTVTPIPQYRVKDYGDAWKEYCLAIKPHRNARRCLRDLVKVGLDCPGECVTGVGTNCSYVCDGIKRSKPWLQEENNPYSPFLWRSYDIGNYNYDLVVYRRPRRSILYKLLCCGV